MCVYAHAIALPYASQGKHFGMFQRDFTSGGYTLAPFATANDIWARIAVWLSVAIGATLAMFTTVLFILYLRAALRQRQVRPAEGSIARQRRRGAHCMLTQTHPPHHSAQARRSSPHYEAGAPGLHGSRGPR